MFYRNILYLILDTQRFVKENMHIAAYHACFVLHVWMRNVAEMRFYTDTCVFRFPKELFRLASLRILTIRDEANNKTQIRACQMQSNDYFSSNFSNKLIYHIYLCI